MNKIELTKIILILEGTYPNFKVIENKPVFNMWFKILQGVTPYEAEKATQLLIANQTYPPNPAMFKKYLDEIAGNNVGEVVRLFKEAVSKFGTYQNQEATEWLQKQSTPAYNVIKTLGFSSLCRQKEENAIRLIQNRFKDISVQNSDNMKRIRAAQENNLILEVEKRKLLEGGGPFEF